MKPNCTLAEHFPQRNNFSLQLFQKPKKKCVSALRRKLFDMFFITLKERFCVWLKVLSNDFSTELT